MSADGIRARDRFIENMRQVDVGAKLKRRAVWTVVDSKRTDTSVRLLLQCGRRRVVAHVGVCITGPILWEAGLRPVAAAPVQREHVTQKPVPLMAEIVSIVPVGRALLDPFMGSGTTGVAAVQTGRKFVGCEINPEIFRIACSRIEAASRQVDLIGHKPPEQMGLLA